MVIEGFVGEQMEFWDYRKYGEFRKTRIIWNKGKIGEILNIRKILKM